MEREQTEFMTIKELAERMRISLHTAQALVHKSTFPKIRIGRKYIIPIQDFEKWVQNYMGSSVSLER